MGPDSLLGHETVMHQSFSIQPTCTLSADIYVKNCPLLLIEGWQHQLAGKGMHTVTRPRGLLGARPLMLSVVVWPGG